MSRKFLYSRRQCIRFRLITKDDHTSAAELARVILHDVYLTARVLRLANSYFYNPMHVKINTVSRALLLIGFNIVCKISMAMTVIDALLKTQSHDYVLQLMGRSFHAAVQARAIAERLGYGSSEEIFIATLLYNLGEMSFFCVDEKLGGKLLVAMKEKGMSAEQAQLELLGFKFSALTLGIIKGWHMGDLLNELLDGTNPDDGRIQTIRLGLELAEVTQNGWHNSQNTLTRLADLLGIPEKDTLEYAQSNAEVAVRVAKEFGASLAADYIPARELKATETHDKAEAPVDELSDFYEPEPMLQLDILRELSALLETQATINQVLEVAMEGLYRGVGLDRVILALLNKDHSELRAKFTLFSQVSHIAGKFIFKVNKLQRGLFSLSLHKNHPYWIDDTEGGIYGDMMTPQMHAVLEAKAFFVYPLVLKARPIGLLYADRQSSGRSLDAAAYTSFKHFGQQACFAIEHISKR